MISFLFSLRKSILTEISHINTNKITEEHKGNFR